MTKDYHKIDPCADRNIQYLDCGDRYTDLHMIKFYSTKSIHTQMSTSKTSDI